MYGTAVPNGDLTRGWAHTYYFALSAGTVDTTRTLWIGPDFQIAKAAPVLRQDGSSNRWVCALTPDEVGAWTLVVRDSTDAVVHTASFRCVDAPEAYHALGVQNPKRGLVEIWPAYCTPDVGANVVTTGAAFPVRSILSSGKFVVPYGGYIYGIKLYTYANPPAPDSLRFFTMDPATTRVRGISENIKARTDIAFAVNGMTTVLFAKPVLARAGDLFGLEVDDTTAGGTSSVTARVATNANTSANQLLKSRDGVLSLSGANTLNNYGTSSSDFLRLRLLMNPPAIGIAGLSHWAGSPNTTPIYADRIGAYSRDDDLAGMLSDLLGVPCVNMAWGGTDIRNWVGTLADATTVNTNPVGLFEKVVVNAYGFHPAVMLYDTVYNDANSGFGNEALAGFTSRDYLTYLDRLLAHCDRAGIELVLLEAFGSLYAVQNATGHGGLDFSAQIEKLNAVAAAWAQQNGVLTIPLNWRLGQYDGTKGEHRSRRYAQKRYATESPGWGLENYQSLDVVHLTRQARKAAAMAMAAAFRNRRFAEPRSLRSVAVLEDLLPPESAAGRQQRIEGRVGKLRRGI